MPVFVPPPQAIVVFGASGDLSKRKILPALYNLARDGLLPDRYAVVGYAPDGWDDAAFTEHARQSVLGFSRSSLTEEAWGRFAPRLHFVSGSFDQPGSLAPLEARLAEFDKTLDTEGHRLLFGAVPASIVPTLISRLGECGPRPTHRVVLEKPFGRDLASAQRLNAQVHEVYDESQIFRIDHFLGKETIQNLLVLRFANTMIERIWNRDAIDHVQITAAETVGVEARGAFYEETGAVRDMIQNHLLQLLAFVAMEAPRSFAPDDIRDETVRVLRTVRPFLPEDSVRGQYSAGVVSGREVPGYRDERNVAPDSTVETFVAVRAFIDNWRWAGVPFYLQTGKRLPRKTTEVTVFFKEVPAALFAGAGLTPPVPNLLSIRIQPEEGMSFAFQAKPPGLHLANQTVAMDFSYREWFEGNAEAYERLIHDAMVGDPTLFIRQDAVERAWEIVTPLIEAPGPLHRYTAGAAGEWTEYPAGAWSEAAARFIAPRTWLVETGAPTARIGDIMTRPVYTVTGDVCVADVAKAMAKGRFGSAVVADGDGRLAGILTERDVLRAAASGTDLTAATAAEWMTANPSTAALDTDIADAAEVMGTRGFRHLPVVADGKVVGIVSQRDVLSARIHAHRPPNHHTSSGST
ncbi:MAG TPA: glucose-6-phosphate dehydrogenase [Acidimicrobiia bacterium]